MDYHLYKQAIYAKFQSLVTQLVFDMLIGCAVLVIVCKFPGTVVCFVTSLTDRLRLDYVV